VTEEQAYWAGFETKCAQYGVDPEKLAQSIPGRYWANRLGARQPDAPLWKRTLSAIPAAADAAMAGAVGTAHGLYEGVGNLTGTYGQKAQSNRYRRGKGLPVHHGPEAAWRNITAPTGAVRSRAAAERAGVVLRDPK